MITILAIVIKAIYSCKQWISNTFISGWENLSNQITLLLSLLETGAGLTAVDKQIKPLDIVDILTTEYCNANGIDYATQKMTQYSLSWENDYQNIYIPTTAIGTVPKFYYNGVQTDTAIDNLIPKYWRWNNFTFLQYYPNIMLNYISTFNNVSMCIFGNQLYISIYDLVYILDMVNYEITDVKRAFLPIQYFFTDGTYLYYYSYNLSETTYNMIVKVA